METFLTVLSVVTEAVSVALFIDILIQIMNKDKLQINTKRLFLCITILIILFTINKIITIYLPSMLWIKSLLFILIGPIISVFIYKSTFFKGICSIIVIAMISALLNIVLAFFIRYINMDPSSLVSNNLFISITTIIISGVQFFIYLLLFFLIKLTKINNNFSFFNTKYIVPQLITMAFCMLPSMFLLMNKYFKYSCLFIFVNFLQLLVISLMSLFNSKNAIKYENTEIELYNTTQYNQTLMKVNEGVRGFKHDMTNIVQAILGYLACKDYKGARKYCENLVMGFNDINVLSILSPTVINDPAIYGVVVSKILIARDKEMNLSLDININVDEINFPKFELSRMLGILLDNAIDAGEQTKDKRLVLNMYTNHIANQDIIIVSNSILNTNIDISQIFEKDYSTKEVPSGFGLYEISKFFNKHEQGNITTSIDYTNKLLTQTITIKHKLIKVVNEQLMIDAFTC